MKKVFEKLRVADFQTDINKCEFFVIEFKYLKSIISMNDIRTNFAKIKTIEKWNTFINLKQIKSFIIFCNFFCRFIKTFFKIVKFLNALVKKNTIFVWNNVCDVIFRKLKIKVLKTSIFCYFNRKKQCCVKIDFSNIVNDELFSQKQKNDLFHSIVFFFKNMSLVECNYEIYDKKLYVIIRCFELKTINLFVKRFTKHKNFEYLMTIKKLIRR